MKRSFVFILLLALLSSNGIIAQEASGTKGEVNQTERKRSVAPDRNSAFSVSTNLFDWADLGTINFDTGFSVSRHISLHLGGKYNPWEITPSKGEYKLIKNQQLSGALGIRYWPWYVFSGWWICAKAQYCQFAETGIWRPALDTGKALGGGLSFGYTVLISKHFNLEFGAGFWGGKLLEHNLYHCPDPIHTDFPRESGPKAFIAINDVNISLQWVF